MTTDGVAGVLAARLAELDEEIAGLTAPPDSTGGISFGKRVGDGTAMAVERFADVSVHERLLQVRADVLRAQERLAAGTYGRCEVCGKPIAPARLEARPWSVRCIDCA